ncbi:hypothetical protein HK104_009497 [Borealophlyctis nickersoniae]|nr:hypothetical protein HK104_009497 [Borealophlyctis nickersoniae]
MPSEPSLPHLQNIVREYADSIRSKNRVRMNEAREALNVLARKYFDGVAPHVHVELAGSLLKRTDVHGSDGDFILQVGTYQVTRDNRVGFAELLQQEMGWTVIQISNK